MRSCRILALIGGWPVPFFGFALGQPPVEDGSVGSKSSLAMGMREGECLKRTDAAAPADRKGCWSVRLDDV